MSADVVIRELGEGDVETVAEIAVAAWAPIFAFYRQAMGEELFAADCGDWREEKVRQVRAACNAEHGAIVCVAEKEGRVVGFATFYVNERSGVGEIGNNAVRPDFQGRGIATAMYEHVFERMRRLGMRFAKVHTGLDASHAPARRAYEKAGFSIQLPSVNYYRAL